MLISALLQAISQHQENTISLWLSSDSLHQFAHSLIASFSLHLLTLPCILHPLLESHLYSLKQVSCRRSQHCCANEKNAASDFQQQCLLKDRVAELSWNEIWVQLSCLMPVQVVFLLCPSHCQKHFVSACFFFSALPVLLKPCPWKTCLCLHALVLSVTAYFFNHNHK